MVIAPMETEWVPVDSLAYWHAQPGASPENLGQYQEFERELRTHDGRRRLAAVSWGQKMVTLWESIRAVGLRNPLICIVNTEHGSRHVLIGNQRFAVVRALDWETVWVAWAHGATPDEQSRDALRLKSKYTHIEFEPSVERWVEVP